MAVIAWEVELVVRAVLAIAVNVYSKSSRVITVYMVTRVRSYPQPVNYFRTSAYYPASCSHSQATRL